jgi:hypothetical protein
MGETMHGLRGKLTYANVISTCCLFLLLGGGGAYAATMISGTTIKPHSIPLNRLKGSLPAGSAGTPGSPCPASDPACVGPRGAPGQDGLPASALATTGRIRSSGSYSGGGFTSSPMSLVPGLSYVLACSPGALARATVRFDTEDPNGTVNAIIVASGIETPTNDGPDGFNVANGPQAGGFPFSAGKVFVFLENSTGDSLAESQLIIDVGARTYSIALHMYTRASDGYCEATGTATVAE